MQPAPQRPYGADMPIPMAWSHGNNTIAVDCGNPVLDDVDYSDADAVEHARAAILRMEVWSDIGVWAFRHEGAPDAVAAIAEMALCGQAAIWQRDNPGRQLAEGLDRNHLEAAQVTLLGLLSPSGAHAMTACYEMLPQGARYMPDTGYPDADVLLGMAISDSTLEFAGSVWEAAGEYDEAAMAYDKVATDWWRAGKCEQAAQAYEKAARNCEAVHAYADAARVYDKAATAWQFDRQFAEAAQACEMAAGACHADGRPDDAAQAYTKAATMWMTEGDPGQAAWVYEQAARSWLAAGMFQAASQAWEAAAGHWIEAGYPARAKPARAEQAMALDRVAASWKAAGRSDKADRICQQQAESWGAAGVPVRAARALSEALRVAGIGTPAAAEVRTIGAALFRVDIESEESEV